MNKTHLHNILEQYIEKYDFFNDEKGHNEGFKWVAASCFKDNWKIDATDFPGMFEKAFAETSVLIDGKYVQPIGGIKMLLSKEGEVEFVRECFRELFSEDSGDIDARQDRVEIFVEKINSHIEKYEKNSWKFPQHNYNAISYLNLWRPKENYFYKPTAANQWANCIEFGDDIGSGKNFSLKKYYKMCDELREELCKNETIMNLYNRRKERVDGFDDDKHVLVYDVIYCANAYNLYRDIPDLEKLSVKERLHRAETEEVRSSLLEKYALISSDLEQTEEKIISLPVITGEKVTHKKWGTGTVVTSSETSIEVEFSEGTKKLSYPGSVGNFILLEDKMKEAEIISYLENESEKSALKKELKAVKLQLERL